MGKIDKTVKGYCINLELQLTKDQVNQLYHVIDNQDCNISCEECICSRFENRADCEEIAKTLLNMFDKKYIKEEGEN